MSVWDYAHPEVKRILCGAMAQDSQCVLDRDHEDEHCDLQGREWWNNELVKKWLTETEPSTMVTP